MALPGNITTITLTGTYIDFTGSPVAGNVKISIPKVLLDAAADRVIIPSSITTTLDVNGSFSLVVPISDDADLDVYDDDNDTILYTFEEAFIGGSTYTFTLPASLGASVDISDLRATATITTYVQPVNAGVWDALVARVVQEEEDLDDAPAFAIANSYDNFALYLDTYNDIAAEYADYTASVDAELNFTEARLLELTDRISDLYDHTASALELRDTTTSGTATGTSYHALMAKWGTYTIMASAYSPTTYATMTAQQVTWTYAEIKTLMNNLGYALDNTGTLTDNYLSITRSRTDGSYGALGLQGWDYDYLPANFVDYNDPTGEVFTFTYRDTADTIRTEANRPHRLMLIGEK